MSSPTFSGNITFPAWALHFDEVRKSAARYVEYADVSHEIKPDDVFVFDDGKWGVDPALENHFPDDHEVIEVDRKITVSATCKNGYLSDLEVKLKRYAVPFDAESLGNGQGGDYTDEDIYHRYDDFLRHSKKEVFNNGDYHRPDLDMLRDMAEAGNTDGIIASIDAFKKSIAPETTILDDAPEEDRLQLRLLISYINAEDLAQAESILAQDPQMLAATDPGERMKILSALHQHWNDDAENLAWCIENGLPLDAGEVNTLREDGIDEGVEKPSFFSAVQALLSRQAMNKIINGTQRGVVASAP